MYQVISDVGGPNVKKSAQGLIIVRGQVAG